MSNLDENERVEADDGYSVSYPQVVKSKSDLQYNEENRDVRNTFRAVNEKLKQFSVIFITSPLSTTKFFRVLLSFHSLLLKEGTII